MRVLVIIHGMAAALSLAAALHLVFMLPRRPFPPRGVALGFLLSFLPLYGLGWWAYPAFREEIRRDILLTYPWMINIFDVKEYISFGALLAGIAVAVMCMQRVRLDPPMRRVAVALMVFVVAVLGFNTVIGILLSNHQTL